MNHECEQGRANSPAATPTHNETVEPGQSSRGTLLRKPDHAIASGLVQRTARHANGVADGAEHAVAAASSSSGSPLPDTLMRKFESSLGADLSGVRIHTGSASEQAADAMGAKAYTKGNDIHFGAGHYDPTSSGGQHLIAHEVAHTVQQSSGAQRVQFKLEVSSPGNSLEHEADRAADAMVSGRVATGGVDGMLGGGAHGGVHRKPSAAAAPAESGERAMVQSMIANGKKNENRLTNVVFHARHPEMAGKSLSKRSPQAEEWMAIRDEIVRPALSAAATSPLATQAPVTPPTTTTVAPSEPGVIERGVNAVTSIAEAAYHTAVSWFSSNEEVTPSESGPEQKQTRQETSPHAGVASNTTKSPPTSDGTGTGTTAAIPALSQFIWYGAEFQDLGAAEVLAVAKIISDVFGIGSPGVLVTKPDESVKKKNPNEGYWWFRADGTPTWDGNTHGGTQYVLNHFNWSLKLNDVSAYLASNPPGSRPAFMKHDGNRFSFGGTKKSGWLEVPDEARNLKLRNIPGGASCFATSHAMMAQAGVHAVGTDADANIRAITSETYTGGKVKTVTVDAAAAIKARTYIDWETKRGKPVLTGVTYTSRNGNSDKITDHWVVIDSRIGEGQYSFHDPGTSSTKAAASDSNVFVWDADSNVFVWDGNKLQNSGAKKYIVSWIRPNQESLAEWNQFWASKQEAPANGPGAAAGEPKPA